MVSVFNQKQRLTHVSFPKPILISRSRLASAFTPRHRPTSASKLVPTPIPALVPLNTDESGARDY